jgi:N-acetyltransferase
LEIRLEHLRAEIGWTWVTRRAWSTGVNIETKLLLLGHAFEDVGLRRVEFKTDARNERARGALLALGATFEGILRKHMVVREGGERDSAYYSVIDDEWPAMKRHLQERLRELK